MIQIIAGEKGKGKTKVILAKVNEEVQSVHGNIVYLDKSNKHMYELSNKVRLINITDYYVENSSEFLGFICGLISSDNDLEKIYFDSFLKIACIEMIEIEPILLKLKFISEQFHVDFVISVSVNETNIPDQFKKDIVVAL